MRWDLTVGYTDPAGTGRAQIDVTNTLLPSEDRGLCAVALDQVEESARPLCLGRREQPGMTSKSVSLQPAR